jgi:hypothetical protein
MAGFGPRPAPRPRSAGAPSPYEVINITADLPHGRVSPARAREVLGWEPRDTMQHLWMEAGD